MFFLAGLTPHEGTVKMRNEYVSETPKRNNPPQTAPSHVAKLSFADYHSTWSGIATSKVHTEAKNPCE